MNIEKELAARSGGQCELCGATNDLKSFVVSPKKGVAVDELVHVCGKCNDQLVSESDLDPNHWRCLNDSMWSEVSSVKVVAYRMLHLLKDEGWPADLLDMMYLEEDDLSWANEGIEDEEDKIVHLDSNGVVLNHGDSVVIIKDLNVKGSSLVAKRGTAVRNISLVHDNAEQIEGKVEGQKIVILTQYVKK
jgi:protein PhnA